MRYRIVYQENGETEYIYFEYMIQVSEALRGIFYGSSNHRIEVLGADGEYHNAPCSTRQVTSQTGQVHTVVEDQSRVHDNQVGGKTLDRELVKEMQELLDDVLETNSTRVQAEILAVVSDTATWLSEQVD